MLVQIGSRLCTDSGTETINEVAREHGIDWSYVHLTRMLLRTCLHKVFYERLGTEQDILETFYLFYMMDEGIHTPLALGKGHCSVLVPELVILHHRVGFLALLGLALEYLIRQSIEGIVAQTC